MKSNKYTDFLVDIINDEGTIMLYFLFLISLWTIYLILLVIMGLMGCLE